MRNWVFVWPVVVRWPLRRRYPLWDESPERIRDAINRGIDNIRIDGKEYKFREGVKPVLDSAQLGKITVGGYIDTSKVPPLHSDRVYEDPIECD